MATSEVILVPLSWEDRMEALLAQLDKVVRPGSKVVFVVSYETDQLHRLFNRLTASWFGIHNILRQAMKGATPARDAQDRLADPNGGGPSATGFVAGGAGGIDVSVELYKGSLNTVVEKHLTTGQVRLILMGSADRDSDLKSIPTSIPYLRLLRRPKLPSVLLLHVDQMVENLG
jgi:hypothetical protein